MISNKTLAILYEFVFPNKNTVSFASNNNARNEITSNDAVAVLEPGAFEIDDDFFDENTIVQPFPDTPLSMFLPIEPAIDFEIFNTELMVEQIATENNVTKVLSRNFNEIDALSSLFASKLNIGSEFHMPKVQLHSNGNMMVEMPYIEGQPKMTYIFSKEMYSNLIMRLYPFLDFGQSAKPSVQYNVEKTMALLPSNENFSEFITEIVEQRDDENNVDTSDSDDDTASTDSSSWESPLSPTTFHKQLALLLAPKPACARNLFN